MTNKIHELTSVEEAYNKGRKDATTEILRLIEKIEKGTSSSWHLQELKKQIKNDK